MSPVAAGAFAAWERVYQDSLDRVCKAMREWERGRGVERGGKGDSMCPRERERMRRTPPSLDSMLPDDVD